MWAPPTRNLDDVASNSSSSTAEPSAETLVAHTRDLIFESFAMEDRYLAPFLSASLRRFDGDSRPWDSAEKDDQLVPFHDLIFGGVAGPQWQ